LTVINPVRLTRYTHSARYLSLLLVAVISIDNALSAALLDSKLMGGTAGDRAGPLLASAAAIYLTDVIAFSPTDTLPLPRPPRGCRSGADRGRLAR